VTEATLRDEALRIVAIAGQAGLPVRVLGGVAISILVPDWPGRGDRPGRDIDVATDQTSRRPLSALLEANGYQPDRRYNAANGHKQLYFIDPSRGRPLDVLIGRMEMCHTFDFADSLAAPGPTVSPADLLLSKLQIVQLNEKDVVDSLVLLSEIPVVETGEPGIDGARIAGYCGRDWGWWRTVTANLEVLRTRLQDAAGQALYDIGRPPRFDATDQIIRLRNLIDDTPKAIGWRLRARIGERLPWYDEPEEEAHQ
jgi:hypothetical protein